MSFAPFVFFVLGLVMLALGAEGLVRGGGRLAFALRVSPLLIGLLVAGFGTSAPELVVSLVAAARGDDTIAVGNVVGSNICNLLGILGPLALIASLPVAKSVLRRDGPIMVGVAALLGAFCLDGGVSRVEGGILFTGLVAYAVMSYRISRRETDAAGHVEGERPHLPGPDHAAIDALACVFGLLLLVLGARLMVDAAVTMARQWGISERAIAVTLVAGGTSIPEMATSLVAAMRRQRDIALGNIVGSCIFNVLCIMGTASLVTPLRILPDVLRFDLPLMIGVSVVSLILAATGRRVSRLEGGLLSLGYVAYIVAVFKGIGVGV